VSYTLATALGIAGALVLDLAILRTRLVLRRVFWTAYPIVLLFQLIFNGVLTSRGVVSYDPTAIIGLRIAGAPVEDLGFGFALTLLTLSLWIRLEPRARTSNAGTSDAGTRDVSASR
jgi:lycopene cyclase domain-containing protein